MHAAKRNRFSVPWEIQPQPSSLSSSSSRHRRLVVVVTPS
jgi:hypothetical protein